MPDMEQYKCPSCGGALEFDSKSQKLKCPYCDGEFDIEVLNEISEAEQKIGTEDKMDGWQNNQSQNMSNEENSSVATYICK